MPSFTDAPIQFNQYIPTVNPDMYGSLILKKQEQYNQGLAKAQNMVDTVAGLPVARPADKKLLQDKLNKVTSQINSLSGGDFSDTRFLNRIEGLAKSVANDSEVQTAISSSMAVKTQDDILAKTKAKNDDSYHPANEWLYDQQKQAWYNDPTPGKPFKAEYSPAINILKTALDYLKTKPDESVVEKDDGYYIKTTEGLKRLDPLKARSMITAVMQNDGKIQKQLAIEAKYDFSSFSPEDIKKQIAPIYDSQLKTLNSSLSSAQTKLAMYKEGSNEYKQYSDAVKSLSDNITDFTAQKDNINQQIEKGETDNAKYLLKKERFLDAATKTLVGNAGYSHSVTTEESTIGKVARSIEDITFKRMERDAKSKVNSGGYIPKTGAVVPFGATTTEGTPSLYTDLDNQLQQEHINFQKDQNKALYDWAVKNNLEKKYFKPITKTFGPDGRQNEVQYALTPEGQKYVDTDLKALKAKWVNGESGSQNIDENLAKLFQQQQLDEQLLKTKTTAIARADEAAQQMVEQDPKYQVIKNFKFPETKVQFGNKQYTINKNDIVNLISAGQKLREYGYKGDGLNIMANIGIGLPNTGSASIKSAPDKQNNILDEVLKQYSLSKDKIAAVITFLRQSALGQTHIDPQTVNSGLQLLQTSLTEKAKDLTEYKNNYLRDNYDALNIGDKAILTGKTEDRLNMFNIAAKAYRAPDEKGNAEYDKDVATLFKKHPKGEGLDFGYKEVEGTPFITVGVAGEESHDIQIDPTTAAQLHLLSSSNPMKQDFEILKWNRTPTGYSYTAKNFNDAAVKAIIPSRTKTGEPSVVQIKYKIEEDPSNGYYLTIYKKPLEINEKPVTDAKPEVFKWPVPLRDGQDISKVLEGYLSQIKSDPAKQQETQPQLPYDISSFQ